MGVTTGKGVRLEKVWTTDSLPVTQRSIPTTKDVRDWPHLKGVDIPDLVDNKVSILSGSDAPEALCPFEVRSREIGQPTGMDHNGTAEGNQRCEAHVHFIHVDQALGCTETEKGVNSTQEQLGRLYNSEFSESRADLMACLSLDDRGAKAIMDYYVKQVGGHYEIAVPWKYDNHILLNNRLQAERRLERLKRR